MAQNTNLNVTPYYDDFNTDKNFIRVLFRPGFPIQARELTTMQSIMQNQVENVGAHLFKDGAMVIAGQVGYDLNVDAIMLQESFLGADVEQYRTQLNDKIIKVLLQVLRQRSFTASQKLILRKVILHYMLSILSLVVKEIPNRLLQTTNS